MNRLQYLIRRLMLLVPTFFGITVVCFLLTRLLPGGPVDMMLAQMQGASGGGGEAGGGANAALVSEEMRATLNKQFGFDRPIWEQYYTWAVENHLGMSMHSYMYPDSTAWERIRERLPVSVWFGVVAFLLSYLVCIPLGIAKALRHGAPFDFATSALVFTAYSIPAFAVGMILKMCLSGTVDGLWDVFPIGGFESDAVVQAVAAGEGLASVFADLGVDAVVSGGQTMNPATEDILAAVQSVPAGTVFVLPNNKNIIMAAEQAQKIADRKVVVLPTRTIPQGITAMLSFDPDADADANSIAMMEAAGRVSTGLVTFAARNSDFDGHKIKKGDIMAMENGKIVNIGTDIAKMTYRLARSMVKKDTSFITLISGCDVSEEEAQRTCELVQAKVGDNVEVTLINGGQPVYYYMIGVE